MLFRFSPRFGFLPVARALANSQAATAELEGPSQISALLGLNWITNTFGSLGPPGHQTCCCSFQRDLARSVSRPTDACPDIERYTFSFGYTNVRQISGKASISSSLVAGRSVSVSPHFKRSCPQALQESSGHHTNGHPLHAGTLMCCRGFKKMPFDGLKHFWSQRFKNL